MIAWPKVGSRVSERSVLLVSMIANARLLIGCSTTQATW
jgi:hypothetical protein